MQIWRIEDWEEVKSVEAPFKKGFIPMVFSLRLGWSPDGQMLALVNAFNPPNHLVPILDRQSWGADVNMVGHQGALALTHGIRLQTEISIYDHLHAPGLCSEWADDCTDENPLICQTTSSQSWKGRAGEAMLKA